MATILHPSFRLKLFLHCWPEKAVQAAKLLEQHFLKREEMLNKQKQNNNKSSETSTPLRTYLICLILPQHLTKIKSLKLTPKILIDYQDQPQRIPT
ncbi:hypothetical protein MJO28_014668, partial [Puccinia striiformis f. sp. tritici]